MEASIHITRVSVLGQGVGADPSGNIYFVPGALPGDEVKVNVLSQDKKYFECELAEVVTASKERVTPSCEYFQKCGGCDWQHWNYADQIKGKENILRHALERASILPQVFHPILGAVNPFNYRNRIQLRSGGNRLGFYKKKSHELVDIQECKVAHPKLNEMIQKLRATSLSENAEVSKLELYLSKDGEVHSLKNEAHGADGFRQINEEQNAELQKRVKEWVGKSLSKKVLELYCGNGNFSFVYAPLVEKVIAIDGNGPAIEEAKRLRDQAAASEGAQPIAFFCEQVDKNTSRKLPTEFRNQYDTLIVDPPRNGMGGALSKLIHDKVKTVIYISCSPQSFTQDAQYLKSDFLFEEVQAIDMFPHTRHIEFIARFTRYSAS